MKKSTQLTLTLWAAGAAAYLFVLKRRRDVEQTAQWRANRDATPEGTRVPPFRRW